jgi:hypothetical protein
MEYLLLNLVGLQHQITIDDHPHRETWLDELDTGKTAREIAIELDRRAHLSQTRSRRLDVTGASRIDQIECTGAVRRLCRTVSAISADAIFLRDSARWSSV